MLRVVGERDSTGGGAHAANADRFDQKFAKSAGELFNDDDAVDLADVGHVRGLVAQVDCCKYEGRSSRFHEGPRIVEGMRDGRHC